MSVAFKKIKALMTRNATHRKGFRIADQTPEFDLKYAAGEMIELAGVKIHAPPTLRNRRRFDADILREFADVMNCLQIYAIKRGWSEDEIDAAQCEKLDSRFEKETA